MITVLACRRGTAARHLPLLPRTVWVGLGCVTVWLGGLASAQDVQKPLRLVVVDQDARGPATTDSQALAALLQAPDVRVLGICVVTGDQWRDAEVQHALRLTEIMGRNEVPVLPGAVTPLVHTAAEYEASEALYGQQVYAGAWTKRPFQPGGPSPYREPSAPPEMPEGPPTRVGSDEPAAVFLTRQVRAHPGEVTVICLGPMTNLALAVRLDPDFPALAKELVFMGGSFNVPPDTYFSAEFVHNPRHEFNLWFDPEAARIVLQAPWRKITCTSADLSVKTKYTQALLDRVTKVRTPLTDYLQRFAELDFPMWDELAAVAWLDPAVIVRQHDVCMDVDCSHAAGYGNTLSWALGTAPAGAGRVTVQDELDLPRFEADFVGLMQRQKE